MPQLVVLLRAVNVGGRNKVPMAPLRVALTAAGLTDVVTHLQSGNVVVSSRKSAAAVETLVRATIESEFGVSISVTVRTGAEIDALVAGDPFADVRTDDSRHGVGFLSAAPAAARVAALDPSSYLPDQFVVAGREIHLWCPGGFADTPFTNTFLEKRLGVAATTRNWRTVLALRDLLNRH